MPLKLSARSRSFLLPIGAFMAGLLALIVALFLVAGSGQKGGSVAGIGGPFALTDHHGSRVTERDLEGAPFLVFFGFTHCPDVCPTTLHDVSQVLQALGNDARAINVLFVTVDPDRDTAEVLKSYMSSFDARIRGLTGTREEIDAMTKTYRAYARSVPLKDGGYTMDHTALLYLMDKKGRFVSSFNLKRAPAEAAADLRRYL